MYILRVKVNSVSLVRLFVTPWTLAYEAPPSVEFSRQEDWGRLPFLGKGQKERGDGSTCVLPASQDPGVHVG